MIVILFTGGTLSAAQHPIKHLHATTDMVIPTTTYVCIVSSSGFQPLRSKRCDGVSSIYEFTRGPERGFLDHGSQIKVVWEKDGEVDRVLWDSSMHDKYCDM